MIAGRRCPCTCCHGPGFLALLSLFPQQKPDLVQGQTVNILGFASPEFPVMATQP